MSITALAHHLRNVELHAAFGGRRAELMVIFAFALLSAGCSAKASGPPVIVVDRTVCSHCGMLVSELAYAAAYQVRGQEARVFDDIGCMLEALGREGTLPIAVWFQDAAGAEWLHADEAIFVASAHVRTPMSGGLLAYADVSAAEKAASAHQGEVVQSFQQLMIRRGGSQ
jgi:nitrous oxide reductase accessory protein NosL